MLRFEDPVLGPRRLPAFQDYRSGKLTLEEGTFSIDVERKQVFLSCGAAQKVNVGTYLNYVIN